MEKKIIYKLTSLYREPFHVTGFEFGKGKKSICIVGNTRGNEVQQIYVCAKLVKKLKTMEEQGLIKEGYSVLVIPSMNPYSVNSKKRFWPTDNTDINRMFPGYDQGETTQRIAAGVFDVIKEYTYGVQFTSFYMAGRFVPHVRTMKTGFEDIELAKDFGLPYVVRHNVKPYDTTTLNYNWQIWETQAFSIYTASTTEIDKKTAEEAIEGIFRFMAKQGILDYKASEGCAASVVEDKEFISVRTKGAGIFENCAEVGTTVKKGEVIARIIDPLEGEVKEELTAPVDGLIFFQHDEPLTYADTAVVKLIEI